MDELNNDYIDVARNGSTAIPTVKDIGYRAPLGKLELDSDLLPKRFEFVADSYGKIIIDNVKRGYDKKGIVGIPKGIFKGLQKAGTKSFYINSEDGKAIIETPGGWKALDLFYRNDPATSFDKFIEGLPAVRGTVQRYELYKNLQDEAARDLLRRKGKVNHLEIFSGPARAPLETYASLLEENPDIDISDINLICLDRDNSVRNETMKIAQKLGITSLVNFFPGKYTQAPEIYKSFNLGPAGIVSSHGGYDYLNDEEIVRFTGEEIAPLQEPGDHFLSTNMHRTIDHRDVVASFLMKFFGGWNQIRERPPGEAQSLIEKTGKYSTDSFIATPKGAYLYDEGSFLERMASRNVHEVVHGVRKQDKIDLI